MTIIPPGKRVMPNAIAPTRKPYGHRQIIVPATNRLKSS